VPDERKSDGKYDLIKHAIDQAEATAEEPTRVDKWLSGELVERAWADLETAQELLVYLQNEGTLRARLPYLLKVAGGLPGADALVESIKRCLQSGPIDRDAVHEVLQQHNVNVGMQHDSVRQFRNRILALAGLLIVTLSIGSAFVSDALRIVMGIGALAGILTTAPAKAIGEDAVAQGTARSASAPRLQNRVHRNQSVARRLEDQQP